MVQKTAAIIFSLLLAAAPARAIILASTGDPACNTTAPAGTLTNSGWQYEGRWNGFLGTLIAPTFFLAARHVGGSTGQVFVLNGFNYHTVAYADSPDSDLRVWQVAETFPVYTPLFTGTNEVGQHCVVFGRGTQRGEPVVINGQTNGWKWGASDGVQRWGENDIASIENDPTYGGLFRCTFDRSAPTTNECHLSSGDSSGAMFIQDGATWKLAGINLGVDGPFSADSSGSNAFQAAMLDLRGFYASDGTNWILIPTNSPTEEPSSFYCTRVSTQLGWLNSVIHFQPGPDLRITAIVRAGDDLQVSLATATNRLYRLDRSSDLASGAWTSVTNNLVGDGGVMTVTDTGAGDGSPRFYRVRLNP
ncbi:MAG: hypothetical protein NTZ16_05400 [Verrucomicrobia bacterium]|nr:hypothetical protein [Verrucomicrobiota bacterium]